jgi:hypothetical protein
MTPLRAEGKHMRKTFLAAVSVLVLQAALVALTLSQQHTWGGADVDEADAVAIAADGSIYVAGTTLSFGVGDRDAFLLKYSPGGELVWQLTYGALVAPPFMRADDFGLGVAADAHGSAYLTGQFTGGSLFVVKFDPHGNLVWQRTWEGGGVSDAIAVGSDGSVYVAGTTFTSGAGHADALLLKLDAAGDVVWAQTWGGPVGDFAHDLAIGADGGIYIAGDTDSFAANDAFVVKFAPDGSVLWEREWRIGEDMSNVFGIGAAADGSIYVTGHALAARGSLILAKFDAAGTLEWSRMSGSALGTGLDVAVAPDGTVYVTGHANSGAGSADAFLLSVLPDGRSREAVTWGGAESDVGGSIAVASDGTVAIAGTAGAPPYESSRTQHRMTAPASVVFTPVGTTTSPAGTVGTPAGIAIARNGSKTFAGATDAVLLRFRP